MGFDTIKQCLDYNKGQEELGKLEKDDPQAECPNCAWPLLISTDGRKACPICGQIWR